MKAISKVDWARLAAYVDGEGCIDIHEGKHASGKSNFHLRVFVNNTDPRLGEWCRNTFGGSVHMNRTANRKWKACFAWTVAAKSAAEVLQGCLPYFLLKREQAELGLVFQRTIKRVGVRGHTEETMQLRQAYKRQLSVLKNRGNRWVPAAQTDGTVSVTQKVN